jgi:hypothetical protein
MSLWEHYYQSWTCRILQFFTHSTAGPYLDSNVFLTTINWHFGSIFKLLFLSEATSVFSAANKDILIMDVLFFCGPARSYKLKTHTHLQMWRTAFMSCQSLSVAADWQDMYGMHSVSKYNLTPGRGLKKHAACNKCVFQSPLRVANTGTLSGLKYNSDNPAS